MKLNNSGRKWFGAWAATLVLIFIAIGLVDPTYPIVLLPNSISGLAVNPYFALQFYGVVAGLMAGLLLCAGFVFDLRSRGLELEDLLEAQATQIEQMERREAALISDPAGGTDCLYERAASVLESVVRMACPCEKCHRL